MISIDDGWPPSAQSALTKSDLAYRQIRKEIVEGVLVAGEILDQEALALRLNLSTTPVREALSRLESEELIVNNPHRRTVVAPLSLAILDESYAVRLSLDPLAVSLTATHASDEDLARIDEFSRREVDASDSSQTLYHNRHLHRVIYGACGNSVLISILERLWDRTDRHRLATLRDDATLEVAHGQHRSIVDAVVTRDGDGAAELMRQHVMASLVQIRESTAAWDGTAQ